MNIILVEADQLSAKWLGCYGNPAAHTPNLDALAAEGVRFEHCYANLPVCMPSRASTLTGRSAQHTGVFFNGWELGLELPTFPQLLRAAGVQTFGVGKFHLECHARSAYNYVSKYGFERAETTEDIRAGDWLDWVEREHPDCYEQALSTVWDEPHLVRYGAAGRDLNPSLRAARRKHPPHPAAPMAYRSVVPERACQTHWIMDRALAFIEARDRSRPFFQKVSFVAPHDPYDPPGRFLDMIDAGAVPPPIHPTDAALQPALERFRTVPYAHSMSGLAPDEWQVMRRHYFASVAFIDEQIGRLRAALSEWGLADNTILLVTADHGDMLGDHGLPTKGPWHFDACMRIPLLVAGPGIRRGKVERQVVTNLDLFPTIVDLAGVTHEVPLEGLSLAPLLTGANPLARPDAALVETYGSYQCVGPDVEARTVVTPRARLTLFPQQGGMLFDLSSDPQERANLLGRPEVAGLERELRDLMLTLMARQYHPLPHRNRHPLGRH
jgi:arylsulfatase A-like enzyme